MPPKYGKLVEVRQEQPCAFAGWGCACISVCMWLAFHGEVLKHVQLFPEKCSTHWKLDRPSSHLQGDALACTSSSFMCRIVSLAHVPDRATRNAAE